MIILFGCKGCNKTHKEKHTLESIGKSFKFYDIDTDRGKDALRRRGLFYREVKSNLPWVINEKDD